MSEDYSDWKVLASELNYQSNGDYEDEENTKKEELSESLHKEYQEVANWCNESGKYHIEEATEDGVTYYKVAANPEPTEEEKEAHVREIRDSYLVEYVDPYVTNPLRWADLSEEEQTNITNYRLYLLNVPQEESFPDNKVMTYDEWKASASEQ